MSRLDVFIDRMASQRACLEHVARVTADLPGPAFELGLGNGRTFDHMREILSPREIYVFERVVGSNPASTPESEFVFLGDVRETVVQAREQFPGGAVLIHADLGGHDLQRNDSFAREISPVVEPLLAPGGMIVSSDKMYFENLREMPLPENAVAGRCFIYGR